MANNTYSPASRYYGLGENHYQQPEGDTVRDIVYLQRRFLPQPERFAVLQQHQVSQDERIDRIAAAYLGDATAFWRLLDANRAMRAEDVCQFGQRINITLPEGVPGMRAGEAE